MIDIIALVARNGVSYLWEPINHNKNRIFSTFGP